MNPANKGMRQRKLVRRPFWPKSGPTTACHNTRAQSSEGRYGKPSPPNRHGQVASEKRVPMFHITSTTRRTGAHVLVEVGTAATVGGKLQGRLCVAGMKANTGWTVLSCCGSCVEANVFRVCERGQEGLTSACSVLLKTLLPSYRMQQGPLPPPQAGMTAGHVGCHGLRSRGSGLPRNRRPWVL